MKVRLNIHDWFDVDQMWIKYLARVLVTTNNLVTCLLRSFSPPHRSRIPHQTFIGRKLQSYLKQFQVLANKSGCNKIRLGQLLCKRCYVSKDEIPFLMPQKIKDWAMLCVERWKACCCQFKHWAFKGVILPAKKYLQFLLTDSFVSNGDGWIAGWVDGSDL